MTCNLRSGLILISALLGLGFPSAAIADETFICNGDEVVRVSLDKLDHMKRTNACVAAHYGLEIKALPVTSTPAKHTADNVARVLKLLSGPIRAKPPVAKQKAPVKRQGRLSRSPSPGKKASNPNTQKPVKKAIAKNVSPDVKVYRQGEALPVENIANTPSDHRNVKVLNAKSRPAQWYRHVY